MEYKITAEDKDATYVVLSAYNEATRIQPVIEAIAEKGLDIELGHAAEYRLDEFSVSQFNSGDTMTYPNNYLLIENSFVQEPLNFRQLLFELMLKDYRLVWAHPERYSYYYDKAKRKAYADIHGIGVKFQVNLLSLTGYYGKEQKRIAEELIEKTDRRRANYYNYYSGKTWGAAESYDLCINTSHLGFEGTAEMLINFIDKARS